ncbi:hypothetical protein M514_00682 [Trichuris suis]|uniref:Uncharacterized protein n=1 Tax=Trichuris suis TaxID=68888 RepID=A0A085MV48_9BILA|nr:hypothetical protein M514_00682 [Trichuris suis]
MSVRKIGSRRISFESSKNEVKLTIKILQIWSDLHVRSDDIVVIRTAITIAFNYQEKEIRRRFIWVIRHGIIDQNRYTSQVQDLLLRKRTVRIDVHGNIVEEQETINIPPCCKTLLLKPHSTEYVDRKAMKNV